MIQRPAGDHRWTTTRYEVSLAVLVCTAYLQRRKTQPWYKKDLIVPTTERTKEVGLLSQQQHGCSTTVVYYFFCLVGSTTLERFSLILILN